MSDASPYSDTGNAKSNLQDYSVSEISAALKKTVEDRFGHVRIRGEITGFRGQHSSGHCYFALKDERARIEAVIWKGNFNRLQHKPEEGLEVIASGKLTTYPGSSKYQIVIDQLEPAGAGALMALLEERKKKLEAEGLFAPERKQLLPYMPRRIGVVTSPTGSVIRDILHRITDRFPLHVMVWPVRVQGETTGNEVSQGIHGFNALADDEKPEVIIVARGGGSIEDLWGFNDEAVVRAAANSEIPLISAVGHETDWTLIDYAADVRAPTPTGAAEMAVPVKAELEAFLASLRVRLQSTLSRKLDQAKSELRAASRGVASPDSVLELPRRRLDEASGRLGRGLEMATRAKQSGFERIAVRLSHRGLEASIVRNGERLETAFKRSIAAHKNNVAVARNQFADINRRAPLAFEGLLENRKNRIDQAERLLSSYNYENVLERGFAIIRDGEDVPLVSTKSVKRNEGISVQMKDGKFGAIVSDLDSVQKAPSRKEKKPVKSKTGEQGDLF
ncbi:MAG: exodeoxyribonuclease VII large subunit [Pseudomonadota bacterium]